MISRAKELGIPIREIGEDDVLNPQKEFRIAFRVACHKKSTIFGEQIEFADFHFMLQHSDGTWSHKMGSLPSEYLGKINPSTYQWLSSDGRYDYNEGTVYFAVTR